MTINGSQWESYQQQTAVSVLKQLDFWLTIVRFGWTCIFPDVTGLYTRQSREREREGERERENRVKNSMRNLKQIPRLFKTRNSRNRQPGRFQWKTLETVIVQRSVGQKVDVPVALRMYS